MVQRTAAGALLLLLAELETKLAARPPAPPPGPVVPAYSVGDQTTAVPPGLRSIGDEETRA